MAKRELAAYTDKITYKTEKILELDRLFIVCYNKLPIAIQTGHIVGDTVRAQRTVFENERQAVRLATRLNIRYKTTQFTVEVFSGDTITNDSRIGGSTGE